MATAADELPLETRPALPTPGASSGKPVLRLSSPVYDLGRVTGGMFAHHTIVVTNTGSSPLEIRDVHASCGCVALGAWPRSIQPGRTGTIPFELRTESYYGDVMETVTIRSNDPDHPETTAVVLATVWRAIAVDPPGVRFYLIPGEAEATLRITNNVDQRLEITRLETSRSNLVAIPKTQIPGREYALTIRAVPPWGGGNIFGSVILHTSLTNQPSVEIPVTALIPPEVFVTPSSVQLPPPPLSEEVTRTLVVRSLWTNALELTQPQINARAVGVRLTPTIPGVRYTLEVTFPRGFELNTGEKLELTLRSNHPRFPQLRLPVSQARPRPAIFRAVRDE